MSTSMDNSEAGRDVYGSTRGEESDIWADVARPSSDARLDDSTARDSTDEQQALPPPSLADLDPFAPENPFADQVGNSGQKTLGHTLESNSSRLEIIPRQAGDEQSSPEPSPTFPAPAVQAAPPTPRKDSSSSGLFTGMFRSSSASGGGLAKASPHASTSKAEAKASTDTFTKTQEAGYANAADVTDEKRAPPDQQQSSRQGTPQKEAHNPFSSIANVFRSASRTHTPEPTDANNAQASTSKQTQQQPLPEVTFDFNRFLEQMRSRSADPIAKYLRSFLREFSRKPPVSKSDQARVINDFLDFIAGKMRVVDPWKAALAQADKERGEQEFDMAMEAMEKLVMNRLWHLTYTPAIGSGASSTDDLERDQVLTQRIRLFTWIKPVHLDLPVASPTGSIASSADIAPSTEKTPDGSPAVTPPVADASESEKRRALSEKRRKDKQAYGYLDFAQREMLKINHYKAPRDKMICIMNTCKVIFGLIRLLSAEEGADTFVPFLIYVVLKSNPPHLVSNVQYIQRFRNPEKLAGETGYYLSSLTGAISFIETLDASSLSSITQSEFEANVEKAIQELPKDDELPPSPVPSRPAGPSSAPSTNEGMRSATPVDFASPNAVDSESPALIAQPHMSFPDATKQFFVRSSDSVERIVSKPLGAIGRIFEQLEALAGDGGDVASGNLKPPSQSQPQRPGSNPAEGGQMSTTRGGYHPAYLSEAALAGQSGAGLPPTARTVIRANRRRSSGSSSLSRSRGAGIISDETSANEAMAEIDRQHEQQRQANIETLRNMFPNIDGETLEVVLLSKSNDLPQAIDALLEMS